MHSLPPPCTAARPPTHQGAPAVYWWLCTVYSYASNCSSGRPRGSMEVSTTCGEGRGGGSERHRGREVGGAECAVGGSRRQRGCGLGPGQRSMQGARQPPLQSVADRRSRCCQRPGACQPRRPTTALPSELHRPHPASFAHRLGSPQKANHTAAHPSTQASTHLHVVLVRDAARIIDEALVPQLVRPVVGQAQRVQRRQRGAPPRAGLVAVVEVVDLAGGGAGGRWEGQAHRQAGRRGRARQAPAAATGACGLVQPPAVRGALPRPAHRQAGRHRPSEGRPPAPTMWLRFMLR